MNICEHESVISIIAIAKEVLDLLGIIIPVALIVYTSIDLLMIVVNPNKHQKSNFKKLWKRTAMAVAFFAIPLIVNIVLNLVNYDKDSNPCFLNANQAGLFRTKLLNDSKKENKKAIEKEKSAYQKQLEDEKEKDKNAKKVENKINKEREIKDQKLYQELLLDYRKKRNEYYYELSFNDGKNIDIDDPNTNFPAYYNYQDYNQSLPPCEGDDCYAGGFFQRYTRPQRGDKFFPELGGVLLGQCVWYAKGRAQEIVNTSKLPANLKQTRINAIAGTSGNGKDWNYTNPGLKIFKHGRQARTASILSWNNSQYGHVGIAEYVDSTGVTISDGWRKTYGGTFNWIQGPRWEDVQFKRGKVSSPEQWTANYIGAVYLLD